MVQEDRTAIVLHTINEIVEDGAVADAWAFADNICKQSGKPHCDVVTTYSGYRVRVSVSPPQAAATISVWSPSLETYVVIYSDNGLHSAEKFPDAWPGELPLIRRSV
jgi:hypothetical protein